MRIMRATLCAALGDRLNGSAVSIAGAPVSARRHRDHTTSTGLRASRCKIRIVGALEAAKPEKATVEFGIDVGVESGQLTSMLVKGTGTATIKVTLEWTGGT
jgi:Trypsin-co-occurring domain 1